MLVVIPDIHQNTSWADRIIKEYPDDNFLLLGDYFDTHQPVLKTQQNFEQTVAWLKDKLVDERFTVLMGNHDCQYRFPRNYGLRCSGFQEEYLPLVNITNDEWRNAKWLHCIGGWLFSHAGIHPSFFNPVLSARDNIERLVQSTAIEDDALAGIPNPLTGAGLVRGGTQRVGGLTWLDVREFEPVLGVKQVFGHTPGEGVRVIGNNVCLDCGQAAYAVLEDNKLTCHYTS